MRSCHYCHCVIGDREFNTAWCELSAQSGSLPSGETIDLEGFFERARVCNTCWLCQPEFDSELSPWMNSPAYIFVQLCGDDINDTYLDPDLSVIITTHTTEA